MKSTPAATWLSIGLDSWVLGCEATSVVALRAARLAGGGPAAGAEAWLMMTEKWQAAAELQSRLIAGGGGTSPQVVARRSLTHYQRKVTANRTRLARG